MSQDTDPSRPSACCAPRGGALPIVIDSPHSGTAYPADFGYSAPFELLRRGEDLYVDRLYENAPQHGATFVAAHFPRAYIDPNRLLADIDEALLDAPWPGEVATGPKTKLGIGLIWRLLGQVPVYQRKLSVAEVQQRIERCYRPYHAALDQAIDGAYRQFGAVWHLNVHSMPDDSYERLGLPGQAAGRLRAGRPGRPHRRRAADGADRRRAARAGLQRGAQRPVQGRGDHRAQRPAGREAAFAADRDQALVLCRCARHQPNAGFERVQRALDAMMAALAAHVRGACGLRG